MTEVAFASPRRLLGLEFRLTRRLPSAWAELTPAQVWACVETLMTETRRVGIIRRLLDLPPIVWRRITHAQMYDLLGVIDWMQPDRSATVAPARWITIDGVNYFTPADKFANVVGIEYAILEELYHAYLASPPAQADEAQCRMLAIILRPHGHPCEDEHSDPRVMLLSREHTETWLPAIRQIPPGVRAWLTMVISANFQFIHDTYGAWLFKPADEPATTDPDAIPDGSTTSRGLDFGWYGRFMDIASEGVFGPLESVHQTPIHTICMYLVKQVDEARRLKAAHEAALTKYKHR